MPPSISAMLDAYVSQQDQRMLLYVYSFALTILLIPALLSKLLHLTADVTRKMVHIGAGHSVFFIITLTDNWRLGILPTATFIGINFVSYKYKLMKFMDRKNDTLGTVYFAFSLTALLAIFWPHGLPWLVAVGFMPLTWGDAFASLVGQRWGKHRYWFTQQRSVEGSVALWLTSFLSVLLALSFSPLYDSLFRALALSAFLASLSMLIEGLSVRGLDNIFVPFGSTFALFAAQWFGLGASTLLALAGGLVLVSYRIYQQLTKWRRT